MQYTKGAQVRDEKTGRTGVVLFVHEAETASGHLEEVRIQWDDGHRQMYSAIGPAGKAPFEIADVAQV
jgi:Mib_herc2.